MLSCSTVRSIFVRKKEKFLLYCAVHKAKPIPFVLLNILYFLFLFLFNFSFFHFTAQSHREEQLYPKERKKRERNTGRKKKRKEKDCTSLLGGLFLSLQIYIYISVYVKNCNGRNWVFFHLRKKKNCGFIFLLKKGSFLDFQARLFRHGGNWVSSSGPKS